MAIRYVSEADTLAMDLRMEEVVPFVARIFREEAAEGRAVAHPRVRLVHPPLPEGSTGSGRPWERDLRVLPGFIEGIGYGVRLGASRSSRRGGGVILSLFDWESMELKALISDRIVHAIRSTAPDGVMAQDLARPDSRALGLVGSGRLARWAAESILAVRPIQTVRIYSPTAAHRQDCAQYLRARHPGIDVAAVSNPREAVEECDVVVAATNTDRPVLEGSWLSPGALAISNTPEEFGADTMRRGRIFTTWLPGIRTHVPPYGGLGEWLGAANTPLEAAVVEMRDIWQGRAEGRSSDSEILIGLNPAYSVLDVALAEFVFQKAKALGVGLELTP